jgi:hypothetical protein
MRTGNVVNTRGKGPIDARLLQFREKMGIWRQTLKTGWASIIDGIKTAYCGDARSDRKTRHKVKSVCISSVLGMLAWPLLCLLNLVVLSRIMELFCPYRGSCQMKFNEARLVYQTAR